MLEYDMVTVIHTPLAPGQFWADYDFDKNNIMLDEELDVDVPSDRPLKLKNKPGMDPKISEDNGRRIYHWTSSHLEREDDTKEKDKDKQRKEKEACRRRAPRHSADHFRQLGTDRPLVCRPRKRPPRALARSSRQSGRTHQRPDTRDGQS